MYKILISDDEKLERKALELLLYKINSSLHIEQAVNGRECIEKWKSFSPDLILLDIKMPILDGLEVAKKIKKLDKNQNIVMVTAYDDFEKVKKALVIGVENYLLKPIQIDELKELIYNFKSKKEENEVNIRVTEDSYIRPAIDYISENFYKIINLESMSKICNMSETYFSKVFKKETGILFSQYLNEFRIKKAENFLETTNLTISEISQKTGFINSTYFIKVFKKYKNKTPLQYRKIFKR